MGDIIQLHTSLLSLNYMRTLLLTTQAAAAALLAGYDLFEAFGQTSTINTWSFK